MTDFHLIGTDTQFVRSYSFFRQKKKGAHRIHPHNAISPTLICKDFSQISTSPLKNAICISLKIVLSL